MPPPPRQSASHATVFIPNDGKQNYPFCILQLVVETFELPTYVPSLSLDEMWQCTHAFMNKLYKIIGWNYSKPLYFFPIVPTLPEENCIIDYR